ncbi:MAG: D-alanyl-D-alanine carboxypeptidase family protein [Actinomycetota bacterium]
MRFFDPIRPMLWLRRAGLAGVVLCLVALVSFPADADLKEDLEKLREEQAEVQQKKKDATAEVDVVTAEANELAAALEVATAEVNEQATKVAAAERRLAAARELQDAAVLAVVEHQAELDELQVKLSDQAIESFINGDARPAPILEDTDPNRAVRMQSLANAVAEDGISITNDLRAVREDLEIEQKLASDAATQAEAIQLELADDLAELERRQTQQAELYGAAEERLERSLAEAAALAELDKDLADQITKKNEELARQTRARNNPAPTTSPRTFPSASDIVNVKGFWVHRDIAGNFESMMNAAQADGINFGGGAYRDSASQIRLRKAHCGTSNYAIYQMPSSQCRPPTARPGASMHEQGKAIDFTYNGRIIGSRNNAGYRWLAANAGNYGFYNLPSEPWHWSVNGR